MNDDASRGPVYVTAVPADARLVQASEYDMRWKDMDAFGHVNNATYFTYFEQVRIDWLRTLGVNHELVLANVSCTFIKPLTYPERLGVKLYAGRAGRSSLETFYEILDAGGVLCSVGHGTVVWFDHDRGCTVEIPAPVRQRLG